MISLDVIENARKKVQEATGIKTVAAGGCVRDNILWRDPKDIDLYVMSDKLDGLLDSILKKIPESCELNQTYKQQPIATFDLTYLSRTIQKIAVQVMLAGTDDVNVLLDSFDWNICQTSWDGDKYYRRDEIQCIKELRVANIHTPIVTLRRGIDFSKRFNMDINHSDLMLLCRKVVGG